MPLKLVLLPELYAFPALYAFAAFSVVFSDVVSAKDPFGLFFEAALALYFLGGLVEDEIILG